MEDHPHLSHLCCTTCGTPCSSCATCSTPHITSCVPPAQPVPPGPLPQLNWSHFKPEFVRKPNGDVEAHLLRTNDWMDTYAFPEDVKVQRYCLTLEGEARLWYESFGPIVLDWNGLQTQFRQQYSKIRNNREQLFHMWRSFHIDKNTETLDLYVTHIRQVAALLGYGKPQVLEIFKNTLPSRLYWVLFPIEISGKQQKRQKEYLSNEKIGRQLVGQLSSMPFMNIQDGYNSSKKIDTVDTQDRLDNKVDKITSMMSKLTAEDSSQNRPFKPKIFLGKRRGQPRNYYDKDRYQNRYRSNSEDRRMSYRGRARYG